MPSLLGNPSVTPKSDGKGAIVGRAYFDSKIIVKIEDSDIPSGQYFAGWALDGTDEIISYSRSYMFYAYRDLSIRAVFKDSEETVKPVVQLKAETPEVASTTTNSTGSFMVTRTVPEGYTYVSSGVLFATAKANATDEIMRVENVESADYKGKITQNKASYATGNGQYMITKLAKYGKVYYSRGYLSYLDTTGNLVTIYTDINKLVIGRYSTYEF